MSNEELNVIINDFLVEVTNDSQRNFKAVQI